MTADDVARYLRQNPSFFEHHSELLESIQVPHPHGGRAIPLADRQVLTLRDKNRALEAKLAELIQFGEENDALSEKVHRIALGLIAARDFDGTTAALHGSLRDDFKVPHVALRLWRGSGTQPEWRTVTPALVEEAAGLAHPRCGPAADHESAGWFAVGSEHIRSLALVPVREGTATFGLIALASEDAKRFYPEMGTLYLERIGDLAAAALARYV